MTKGKGFSKKIVKHQNDRHNVEVIYGKNACFGCFEGIKNGVKSREIFEISILQSKFDEYIKKVPSDLRSLVKQCNNHDLFVLTHEQDKHQGIACKVSGFKFLSLDDLLKKYDAKFERNITKQDEGYKKNATFFLLDRVQDPHNVGNIIRTAFCFGVDGLILPDRDACGITPAVVRTSAGYSEQLPIYQAGNVANTLEKMKKIGFCVVGFDVKNNTNEDLSSIVKKYDKCVFVFGAEGDGMRDLTKKQCDVLIRLPMAKGAESLNVANTTAIVGWEVMKHNISGGQCNIGSLI